MRWRGALLPALFLSLGVYLVARAADPLPQISPAERAALNRIKPESLRADLEFLASDAAEGRGTPSRGLELAADYIGEKFRSHGLQPAGGDGSYFQTARFEQITPSLDDFELTFRAGGDTISVPLNRTEIRYVAAIDIHGTALRLPGRDALPPMAGRVVVADEGAYGDPLPLDDLEARHPALVLLIGATEFETPERNYLEDPEEHPAPVIRIHDPRIGALWRAAGTLEVSLHLSAPAIKRARLRNVVAVLPGSDPAVRDQYILLTAHYDHLGSDSNGIFAGANDNASGTVSVLGIAEALATLTPHPRRSILFIAFFGEEENLTGSRYYARHPLVPLKQTVANVNLEHMGRTDELTGPRISAFAITGPSFSTLPALITPAVRAAGVSVWRRRDADDFFIRSDNLAFAERGVVAHTIAVAFDFPGYHSHSDTPEKIDYVNMARVDRGVAAGLVQLADAPAPPRWTEVKAAGVFRTAGAENTAPNMATGR